MLGNRQQTTPNIALNIDSSTVLQGKHQGRYNASSPSEVTLVLIDDKHITNRDIVLRRCGGGLLGINEALPAHVAFCHNYCSFYREDMAGVLKWHNSITSP